MKTCPVCESEFEGDGAGGLCPKCLITQALDREAIRADAPAQCTKCQSALADLARFCDQCGSPVAPVAADEDPIRIALESRLRGQYRIIRLLGRGGMGAVYLARDLILEREVAVKVVRTSSNGQEVYDRFRREAKTAAKLSHPNIVPLHSLGQVEGMPYFVMGYVRGESLAARLQRDGRMSEEEGLRLLSQIADALEHAHRQGVVHRDVKPDNVLIEDESGRALLTDFGLAKAVGQGETVTSLGVLVGTPQYMSPEQAEGGGGIDGRSDIYSLGVMAYAMLSGRLPFEGKSAADLLSKHLTQQPPSLRSLNPSLSQATAQAIERCLVKDPVSRWQDARSLRLALGVGEESQLPDALHAVEGRGIPGLVLVLACVGSFWLFGEKYGFWDDGGVIFSMLMLVGFSSMYLFLLGRMRREGFPVGQSQAAIWREPSWWLWWYPRAWRRRGNVWDRLPQSIRVLRSLLPMLFVAQGVLVLSWFLLLQERFATDRPMEITTIFLVAGIITTWLVNSRRTRRVLARKGIEGEEVNRILFSAPPSRVSFWSRPQVGEALEPAAEGEGVVSKSPDRHLQLILRRVEELPAPLRPLGAKAAAAARLLLSSIEDADREITELARNLDAGDEARVTAKINGMDRGKASLRSILEKELELIRGVGERIEEAKEVRSQHMEMLRSLSAQLAALRARTLGNEEIEPLTDRVRALCDEIAATTVGEQADAETRLGSSDDAGGAPQRLQPHP